MPGVNYWAIAVAAVIAFVVSSVWYTPLLFGKAYLELRGLDPAATANTTMPIGTILGELVRSLVVAYVLARKHTRPVRNQPLKAVRALAQRQ